MVSHKEHITGFVLLGTDVPAFSSRKKTASLEGLEWGWEEQLQQHFNRFHMKSAGAFLLSSLWSWTQHTAPVISLFCFPAIANTLRAFVIVTCCASTLPQYLQLNDFVCLTFSIN